MIRVSSRYRQVKDPPIKGRRRSMYSSIGIEYTELLGIYVFYDDLFTDTSNFNIDATSTKLSLEVNTMTDVASHKVHDTLSCDVYTQIIETGMFFELAIIF